MYNPAMGGFSFGRRSLTQNPFQQIDPNTGLPLTSQVMPTANQVTGLPPAAQQGDAALANSASGQAPKKSAWGQGGKAWQILGIIGDGLQTAAGGHGTFMPTFLDLQAQTKAEQQRQQALAAQTAAGRSLGLSDAQIQMLQTLPPDSPLAKAIINQSALGGGDDLGNDEFTRAMALAGYKPGTPEYQKAAQARVTQLTDPTVTVPLSNGTVYSGPRSGLGVSLGMTPAAQPAPSTLPRVSSADDYNNLPNGAHFIDPQGNIRTKGGTANNGGGNFR